MITVYLRKRHYGIHNAISKTDLDIDFKELVEFNNREIVVDEDKLLELLPKDFLPWEPKYILLSVGYCDETGSGVEHAISYPKFFRSWAKYFDSYSLSIETSDKQYERLIMNAD